jgi:hypothetical protein
MELMSSCRPSTSEWIFRKMETLEVIRRTLATSLNLDESEKSSHWKFYTKQFVIDDNQRIKGISGFSSRSKAFPFSGAIHERAQKRTFPNFEEAKKSRFHALAKHICKLQERAVDVCVIRHVFTFMLLEEFSLLKKNLTCCVIGDGQSNFISIASAGKFFDKLISINLGEVLLSDLDLLEKLPLQPRNVRLAQGKSELKTLLKDKHVNIILVRAHDKNLLEVMNIDLFINMASFQEMTNQLISQYFQVIKSNKATLYCCNREVKVLRGGERLEFDQYPWGDAEILVDEGCPWHKYFYDFRSPRLFRRLSYDGSLRHRLARFK